MIIGRLIPTGPYSLYIQWEVNGTDLLEGDRFRISRSSGEEDRFSIIEERSSSYNYYLDEGPNNISYDRVFYYMIDLIRDNEIIDSSPKLSVSRTDGQDDFIYRMIQNSSDIGYRRLFGTKCYILQRRTWGTRCPCTDDIRGTVAGHKCKMCYGTGYLGGFYAPIITRCKRNPKTKRNIIQLFAMEPADDIVKLMNYPVLKPGDIFVDNTNERFEIINIRNNFKLDLMVSQLAQIRRLPASNDTIYHYDLDLSQLNPDNYIKHIPL